MSEIIEYKFKSNAPIKFMDITVSIKTHNVKLYPTYISMQFILFVMKYCLLMFLFKKYFMTSLVYVKYFLHRFS